MNMRTVPEFDVPESEVFLEIPDIAFGASRRPVHHEYPHKRGLLPVLDGDSIP